METKKKKKKSKRRHDKDIAEKSLFQSELYQAGVNASLNERAAESKEADSPSSTMVGTQNFAATNEGCTLVDKRVMLKRKRKTKKSRSGTENHEVACEGMQNMKKYQNVASETSTKHRKNKWKGISSEDTTHMEDTLIMDTAHKEHSGCDSKKKKKKKKKRKALEAENSA
jgi:hypothetical protein